MDKLLAATKKTPRFTITGSYIAKCVSVYDGDTIQVVFEIFGKLQRFTCRIAGYNTMEMDDPDNRDNAVSAREYLRTMVLDRIVYINVHGFEKYGRLLIDCSVVESEENSDSRGESGIIVEDSSIKESIDICSEMLRVKYGKPYDGRGEK